MEAGITTIFRDSELAELRKAHQAQLDALMRAHADQLAAVAEGQLRGQVCYPCRVSTALAWNVHHPGTAEHESARWYGPRQL